MKKFREAGSGMRFIRAYITAIASLSVFLAIPGTAVGIYSGNPVDFVVGYVLALLLSITVLVLLLLPLLPLLVMSAGRDWRAKLATILLVPVYFVLLSEAVGRIGPSMSSVEALRPLVNDAEKLLPLIVVPAMIIVLNFFIFEADLRKRSSQATMAAHQRP